jgi:nicotinamidase-related amidase
MSRSDAAVLVIDVQEKLLPAIVDKETILARCDLTLKCAGALGVPVIATEQYPKGLGATVGELAGLVKDPIAKVSFSSCGAPSVLEKLAETKASKVLIVGIEAHVCVQQTVFDLLAKGYRVYVAADAVGSRRTGDKEWALRRMADAGAVITTAESAVFEWTETAAAPEFKQISQFIKEADAKSR